MRTVQRKPTLSKAKRVARWSAFAGIALCVVLISGLCAVVISRIQSPTMAKETSGAPSLGVVAANIGGGSEANGKRHGRGVRSCLRPPCSK